MSPTRPGEHGTGRNMAPFVELEWGAAATDIMRRVKAAFDPGHLLNPGVILNEARHCMRSCCGCMHSSCCGCLAAALVAPQSLTACCDCACRTRKHTCSSSSPARPCRR